jgi:hypothetical protein
MQRKGVSPVLAKLSHVTGDKPANSGVVWFNQTQLAGKPKRTNHSENESTNQPRRNTNLCSFPGTIQQRNEKRNAGRSASCVSQKQGGRRKGRRARRFDNTLSLALVFATLPFGFRRVELSFFGGQFPFPFLLRRKDWRKERFNGLCPELQNFTRYAANALRRVDPN